MRLLHSHRQLPRARALWRTVQRSRTTHSHNSRQLFYAMRPLEKALLFESVEMVAQYVRVLQRTGLRRTRWPPALLVFLALAEEASCPGHLAPQPESR